MPQNPLTLTRQSIYELVWSKLMSQLAGHFGISDVGLASGAVKSTSPATLRSLLRGGRPHLPWCGVRPVRRDTYLAGNSSVLTPTAATGPAAEVHRAETVRGTPEDVSLLSCPCRHGPPTGTYFFRAIHTTSLEVVPMFPD
jgi:hypothetical protein